MQQFAAIVDEKRPEQHIGEVLKRLSGGRKPTRILCTGHSLGGALATLGAQASPVVIHDPADQKSFLLYHRKRQRWGRALRRGWRGGGGPPAFCRCAKPSRRHTCGSYEWRLPIPIPSQAALKQCALLMGILAGSQHSQAACESGA